MEFNHLLGFVLIYLEVSLMIETVHGHHGSSHYCSITYYVKVSRSTRYYTSCGWWGRSRCARYRLTYISQSRVNHKNCCTGYQGDFCNIPICSEVKCKTNGVCIAPNECYCRPGSSGSECSLALCSEENDCYPGTCNAASTDCICASGFTGDTCSEMEYAGSFQSCNAQLFTSNQAQAAFSGTCGIDDENGPHSNDHSYFSNMMSLTGMRFNYEVIYRDQSDLPHIPSEYMVQARFGLINSYVITNLTKQDGTIVWANLQTSCTAKVAEGQSAPGEMNPHASLHCKDITEPRGYTIEHNDKLEVEVVIKSGGFKETKSPTTNARQNRTYTGSTLSQHMDVTFDIEPPFHCEETVSCQDENQVPCGWMPDLAVERNLTVRWFGWNDTGSGIKEYRYTIYAMELDSNGLLIDSETPTREEKIWQNGEDAPRFFFDIPAMYSMILEVFDYAGNSKKARSVMLFDNTHKVDIVEDNHITVSGLQKWDDAFWMTSASQTLRVTWTNRFHTENGLLNEVKHRTDLIDDDTGNRTTSAVDHVQGVVRFEWTYNKGQANTLSSTPTETWTASGLTQYTDITDTLQDGQSIAFFVRAFDAVRNSKMESISIHIDTSPALYEENKSTFEANADNLPEDLDYGSRYIVSTVDTNSGIRAIEYNLTDVTSSEEIISLNGTAVGQRHPVHLTSDLCTSSGECYCVPLGPCYNILQNIWINNCDLVDRDGHEFRLDFSIVNGAGTRTDGTENIGILQGLNGVGYYPAAQQFRSLNSGEFGTKVTVAWYYEAACYQIDRVRLEVTEGEYERAVEISGERKTYELTDLTPNTAYTVDITLHYIGGQTSDTKSLKFSTGEMTEEEETGGGGLGAGAIIGIVIAVIIILLLGILIAVVIFCRTRGPAPLRSVSQSVAKRISRFYPGQKGDPEADFTNLRNERKPQLVNNLAYSQNTYSEADGEVLATKELNVAYKDDTMEDDDVYIYGTMETAANAQWKLSTDKLTLGQRLPNPSKRGFADLKKATLHDKNGNTGIVAKMCKANASKDDILLMTAKMNFLATDVRPHNNILRFIGGIPPPQGPILLLEFCTEGKLLDWLKKQTVNDDVMYSMVDFTINIAAGMAHLHNNRIVHKRLGARNILLTEVRPGQLVAKVSGFGPMPSEKDDDDSKEKIPIKWMAPEQFEKPHHQKRLYTSATDIWSYGIVCQEIFSKGDALYKNMSVPQLKQEVKNGYQMPTPEHCPPFISKNIMRPCWDLKPSNRPSFQSMLKSLSREYESRGNSEDYVYDDQEEQGGGMYQNAPGRVY